MNPEERVPRINELKIRVKPDHFLNLAHEALKNNNSSGAIQHYLQYIANLNNPDEMKLTEQINLTKLVMNLNNQITEPIENFEQDILKCYLTVLNTYPENALLLNAFGVFFFSQGEYAVARSYFQKAAAFGYLPGEKNFLHVIWHLIPRWHFRMLNDKKRNESYRDAINKAISEGFRDVYDIGSGCGLLSLIAANAAEDVQVVAFEESKILSDIASNIFKRNKVQKTVRLIESNSNLLENPPAPCNLIVTEIFDAGVFGEDCLKTIKHAVDHFISSDKFKIIPAGVKLYVTAFQSDEVTRSYRYAGSLPELGLGKICMVEIDQEPYDAEYLRNKDVKYLSPTKPFLNVNFYDSKQLGKLLTDTKCIEEIELECIESGMVHALAVWFDLTLDEEITISTHPSNLENLCWEQAVFHLDHPIQIKTNDILKLKPSMIEGQVSFQILSPASFCDECFEVSKEIISFLNDTHLVECIKQAACSYENTNIRLVDFNVFPLFGFLMAKRGATVYHVYKDECDLVLFNHVVALNDLPTERVFFIHQKSVEKYMVFVERPDLVYTDLIKPDGSWNKEEFTLETEAKFNCASMPRRMFLNAQFISSKYLDFCNKVDDSNAFNFEIFAEINEYSGSEHPNLGAFEYEQHSTIITFDISDLEKIDFHEEGTITEDGSCNGILYWFDMQFSEDESNRFSTLNSTHYDRSCTLLNNAKCLKKGEKIMLHIMRLEGHLKVYCD